MSGLNQFEIEKKFFISLSYYLNKNGFWTSYFLIIAEQELVFVEIIFFYILRNL